LPPTAPLSTCATAAPRIIDRTRGGLERATTIGIVYAFGVAIAFSAVAVSLYAAFRAGAPLSIASPLVRLSGVIVASLVGVLAWNEPVTPRYLMGLLFAITGVYLIVTR